MYLSSSGAALPADAVEASRDPKRDIYESLVRVGRLSAFAAFLSSGEVADEKLYGAALESKGCTCEFRIFRLSSTNAIVSTMIDNEH